jgi:hypothetical protein
VYEWFYSSTSAGTYTYGSSAALVAGVSTYDFWHNTLVNYWYKTRISSADGLKVSVYSQPFQTGSGVSAAATWTLAQIRTKCQRDIRDPNATTFSTTEIDDYIGQGIESLTSFYPQEMVGTLAVADGTFSYSLPQGMTRVFRVEMYNSDDTLMGLLEEATYNGPNSGYQLHGGNITIPHWTGWDDTTLRLYGYGPWTYIDSSSSSSSTTNLDQRALWAVRKFVTLECFERLLVDRVKFQQYQQTPDGRDVTTLTLMQLRNQKRAEWAAEQSRLRLIRKNG